MADEILKKIKIDVNSSEYKALEKSIKEISNLEKEINKILKDNDNTIRKARLAEIDYQKKLTIAENQRKRQRLEWETGNQTFIQKYQKYRGISGLSKRIEEKKVQKGLELVSKLEERILEAQAIDEKLKILKESGKAFTKKGEINKKTIEGKEYQKLLNQKGLIGDVEKLKDIKSQSIGQTKTDVNRIKTAGLAMSTAAKLILKPFRDLASGAIEVFNSFMDLKKGIATFATTTTLITNKEAREQQIKYGLTAAQNFAFTQAKTMLNITGDEDLLYMNVEQRNKFNEYMQKYSLWYERLQGSGVLNNIQQMQLEFQELKRDFSMEFLSWIAANKESIMTIMRGLFEAVKAISESVLNVIRLFSGNRETSAISGIANQYSTNNRTITVYANTTNNNTGIASQSAGNAYSEENFNNLAKQLIAAIGG